MTVAVAGIIELTFANGNTALHTKMFFIYATDIYLANYREDLLKGNDQYS
jgi:hypothetical protein